MVELILDYSLILDYQANEQLIYDENLFATVVSCFSTRLAVDGFACVVYDF